MLWYVIHVKTGEEQNIAATLRENGMRALVPVENRPIPVSYTHLDVYKRQPVWRTDL